MAHLPILSAHIEHYGPMVLLGIISCSPPWQCPQIDALSHNLKNSLTAVEYASYSVRTDFDRIANRENIAFIAKGTITTVEQRQQDITRLCCGC